MLRLPFGDPDGSRADIEHLIQDFVSLDGKRFTSGIAISDSDRNIRLIVGKKGSGKTVYLRRLQDSAKKEESIFASKIAQDIPTTNSVMGFCQMFDTEKVTEAWQSAWRVALILSALSHVICKRFFSTHVDTNGLSTKLSRYGELIPNYTVERSPYSELKDIIAKFRTSSQFWTFAQDSAWDDIQTILGTCLKTCPPLFLYLDASDDEFAHAPMDWHRSRKGYSTL